jgi:hypothetical protein
MDPSESPKRSFLGWEKKRSAERSNRSENEIMSSASGETHRNPLCDTSVKSEHGFFKKKRNYDSYRSSITEERGYSTHVVLRSADLHSRNE